MTRRTFIVVVVQRMHKTCSKLKFSNMNANVYYFVAGLSVASGRRVLLST